MMETTHEELQPGDIVLKVYTDTSTRTMCNYAFYEVAGGIYGNLYYGRRDKYVKLYKISREFVSKKTLKHPYSQVRLISNA